MNNLRQERASAEVLKVLPQIIREKINDPRLNKYFVTFTYAKVSADFRHCKIGFSILNGDAKEVLRLLKSMEGFIKKELLKTVKFPYAPVLEFAIDYGEDNSKRVNDLLKKLDIPKVDDANFNDEDL